MKHMPATREGCDTGSINFLIYKFYIPESFSLMLPFPFTPQTLTLTGKWSSVFVASRAVTTSKMDPEQHSGGMNRKVWSRLHSGWFGVDPKRKKENQRLTIMRVI